MKQAILIWVCLFLGACSGSSNRVLLPTDTLTPSPTVTVTSSPTVTVTPTNTATLTPSPTVTQTPTRTAIPQGVMDQIDLTYRMIILVNGNAAYLLQLAEQVRDRKVSDVQKMVLILGLIELVDQAEQQMKDFRPFPALDEFMIERYMCTKRLRII